MGTTAKVRGSASVEGFNMVTEQKGSIRTTKMIVTKLCKYLGDERSSN